MASPYAYLRHAVIPLDAEDRAEFARRARVGRTVVGCMALVLTAFVCVAYGAGGAPSNGGVPIFAVVVVVGAFAILGLAMFALRPAMMERDATKVVYTGVVTAKRSVTGHVPSHPPHMTDPSLSSQTTLHYVALDGVEFQLPPNLATTVEVGRTYQFHALGESQVFRITPASPG